jgi:hypothetical protein
MGRRPRDVDIIGHADTIRAPPIGGVDYDLSLRLLEAPAYRPPRIMGLHFDKFGELTLWTSSPLSGDGRSWWDSGQSPELPWHTSPGS